MILWFHALGEFSLRAAPAANLLIPRSLRNSLLISFPLARLFLFSSVVVTTPAPAGCPKHAEYGLYYNSKEACDELRQWIASQ